MLNKNSYLEYLRCPREFWLNFHSPAKTDDDRTLHEKHLMEQGFEVLQLAKKMTIFNAEAAGLVEFHRIFSTDYLTTSADITVTDPATGELFIYEVKSASKVKPEYIDDIAFQQLTAEMLGYVVAKTFIITIDTTYTLNGRLDPDKLFKLHDVTEDVAAMQDETLANTEKALKFIFEVLEPEISLHCDEKLDCGFIRYHFNDIPVYNVTHISNLKTEKCAELIGLGILDIRSVPADFALTDRQRRQVDIACGAEPVIERESIRAELDGLKYPLNFLDYETFQHAVPKFSGIRPYQQMVFQYSLHTIAEPAAEPTHSFYLSKNDGQFPPREVAEHLAACFTANPGTVIVWNAPFERTRNKELAVMFPDLADHFLAINESLYDLEKIFSSGLYLHPEFRGKSSIKNIQPVLFPAASYKDLPIGDGQTAAVRWYHMAAKKVDDGECEQIYNDLCTYCHLDTLAMVEIFNVLRGL